jgi:hypothetical protein
LRGTADAPDDELAPEEGPVEVGHGRRDLLVVVGQAPAEADKEEEADDGERPDDEADPPRLVDARRAARKLVAPVPEGGRPELLEALDHARAESPDLGRGAGLLAEVAAEEEEAGGRGDGVGPARAVRDARVDALAEVADGREADHEEGDGEEDPRDREDENRGLVPEEAVPDEREEEEDLLGEAGREDRRASQSTVTRVFRAARAGGRTELRT